jgi:hypothetical protein
METSLMDISLKPSWWLLAAQECVKAHYEENESDFNVCPSVNFVNILDPFKVQIQVYWTYNFGGTSINCVIMSIVVAVSRQVLKLFICC